MYFVTLKQNIMYFRLKIQTPTLPVYYNIYILEIVSVKEIVDVWMLEEVQ